MEISNVDFYDLCLCLAIPILVLIVVKFEDIVRRISEEQRKRK